MNELLNNPAVQTALVLVIVTALNALVAWLKARFPTQVKLVESNWCYLQPVVDAAIAAAQSSKCKSELTDSVAESIILKSLAQFADDYRKFEGKDATSAEVQAARSELTTALGRVVGG